MMPARTIWARDLPKEGFASDRSFGLLEYAPGHCRLLVRSPKGPDPYGGPRQKTNLDLLFWGVEYMALPTLFFPGVEIVAATPEELASLSRHLGRSVGRAESRGVLVLRSGEGRFPVVAPGVVVSENDWDPYESPIESSPSFRYEGGADGARLVDLLAFLREGGTLEGFRRERGAGEGTELYAQSPVTLASPLGFYTAEEMGRGPTHFRGEMAYRSLSEALEGMRSFYREAGGTFPKK